MGGILRISDAASLALHASALLASRGTKPVSSAAAAEALGVSRDHLSKVFQRLTRSGLVRSTRGPGGGFLLAREADSITLLEIYEAVEGPLEEVSCLLPEKACTGACILGGLLHDVHRRVRNRLATTTLSSLHAF